MGEWPRLSCWPSIRCGARGGPVFSDSSANEIRSLQKMRAETVRDTSRTVRPGILDTGLDRQHRWNTAVHIRRANKYDCSGRMFVRKSSLVLAYSKKDIKTNRSPKFFQRSTFFNDLTAPQNPVGRVILN